MEGMAILAVKGAPEKQPGERMLAERDAAAILYAELRNFTRLSEMLDPERVLQLASAFFSLAAAAVKAHSGEVFSLQNDALVAAFRTGKPAQSAGHAIQAAQALLRDFGPVGERWQNEFGFPAPLSPGVHPRASIFVTSGPHVGVQDCTLSA